MIASLLLGRWWVKKEYIAEYEEDEGDRTEHFCQSGISVVQKRGQCSYLGAIISNLVASPGLGPAGALGGD